LLQQADTGAQLTVLH